MRRFIVLSALAAAAAGALVQPAQATNECRGLQVCVRVVGPWVVVPAGLGSPRTRVDYQLACPRGFLVGGLDAELSDRAIDIAFGGKLGSPVGPGVTTSRSALFAAAYSGGSARAPSFRPRLGCIPAAGSGAGPVPLRRVQATFPPGEPTVRRVRTVGLRPGAARAVAACGAGERLVSGWHAVGFYTSSPPAAALIGGVRATRAIGRGRVDVRIRSGFAIAGVRAVLQVGAVCGGGS